MIRLSLILLSFFSLCSHASIPVTGIFTATQSCPAFQSKNKLTNPNHLSVQPQQQYTIHEINQDSPSWIRIKIMDNESVLGWVRSDCGTAQYTIKKQQPCDNTPGLADSYVLALSWQPGFCETFGYEAGKPECLALTHTTYQAEHMVLHGLWPNQSSCGVRYGYCDGRFQSRHCDYSPLEISEEVQQDLSQLMPSFAYGSCLERHEWNRHGSCQILSADQYFALGIRLAREANQTTFATFLREHVGEIVRHSQLRDEVAKAFGSENAQKIFLGCKNGMLVDVFIQLPALIPQDEPILSLIDKAPMDARGDACPYQIKISNFQSDKTSIL